MKFEIGDITFGTTNNHKIDETSSILGIKLNPYSTDDLNLINKHTNGKGIPEIQSMSIKEVVEAKARSVYEILKKPILVEDTGFYAKGLNGYPGPFIKYLIEKESGPGLNGLFKLMDGITNREVDVITGFSIYDGENYYTGIGTLRGKIPLEPRGNQFGWSNAFEVDGLGLTFGEITPEHKNQISMRKFALQNFLQKIKD